MKLDFNKKLKDHRGNELDNLMADDLADFLALKTPGIEPAKSMLWVDILLKDKVLEIDEVDAIKLKNFINSSDSLFNFAKRQLLKVFDVKK